MKILKFSIIASLLLFMISCKRNHYIPCDNGVVIGIEKVGNANKVTIKINTYRKGGINTYMTFLTNKKYNIDDIVYFKK